MYYNISTKPSLSPAPSTTITATPSLLPLLFLLTTALRLILFLLLLLLPLLLLLLRAISLPLGASLLHRRCLGLLDGCASQGVLVRGEWDEDFLYFLQHLRPLLILAGILYTVLSALKAKNRVRREIFGDWVGSGNERAGESSRWKLLKWIKNHKK